MSESICVFMCLCVYVFVSVRVCMCARCRWTNNCIWTKLKHKHRSIYGSKIMKTCDVWVNSAIHNLPIHYQLYLNILSFCPSFELFKIFFYFRILLHADVLIWNFSITCADTHIHTSTTNKLYLDIGSKYSFKLFRNMEHLGINTTRLLKSVKTKQ